MAGWFDATTLFLTVVGVTTLAIFVIAYIFVMQLLCNILGLRSPPWTFLVAIATSFGMYALLGFGLLKFFPPILQNDAVGWTLLVGSWLNFFLSISMLNRICGYVWSGGRGDAVATSDGGWQWVVWL